MDEKHRARLDGAVAPSSSVAGFFQAAPVIRNQFHSDSALRRAFSFFLPSDVQPRVAGELSSFGEYVLSPSVLRHVVSAERDLPSLQTWDTFGRRVDVLRTSEGWRTLQDIGIAQGMVSTAYGDQHADSSRLFQFLKYHLWSASSAIVTCPSAMTDGAATALRNALDGQVPVDEAAKRVFRSAYTRLTSSEPGFAWTAGQWMTERSGGSDVSQTETRAVPMSSEEIRASSDVVASDGSELGPWKVSGFKWFSSATDADCAVLLAKTGPGSGEISAFFAPMRTKPRASNGSSEEHVAKEAMQFNGIFPQRLKNKMGTKALPTAELVLDGMRAYMIGKPGEGTRQISAILNITRVHNAVAAIGFWGRGLAVARAFAEVRKTGGRLLADIPLHVRGLAEQQVEYKAMTMLTFFVVSLLGVVERANKSKTLLGQQAEHLERLGITSMDQATLLLRLLTPVTKALTAVAAIHGLRACMEALGGVGYLENEDPALNIARLFRDANVLAIWEGTTDVMAFDTIRVLKGKEGVAAFSTFQAWTAACIRKLGRAVDRPFIEDSLKLLEEGLRHSRAQELHYDGRKVMETICGITCYLLLTLDAHRSQDDASEEIARRWRLKHLSPDRTIGQMDSSAWAQRVSLDRQIVFGSPAQVSAPRSSL